MYTARWPYGVVQARDTLRAFGLAHDQASGFHERACHRFGYKAGSDTAQLRVDLGMHGCDREHVLPAEQANGEPAATLHRVGHGHRAVLA